jgi:capsular polysaccharide transport system permease protein
MQVKNFAMVAFGFLSLFLFSFSYALFLSVLNVFFDSTTKIIGFSMTPLIFGSAIVYTIESLPVEFQELLLYNPLTHFMEIIHGFYFYSLDDHFVSYSYISFWTLSLLYLALWFYIKLEKRIISA